MDRSGTFVRVVGGIALSSLLALFGAFGCSDVAGDDTTRLKLATDETESDELGATELAQGKQSSGSESALVARFREGRDVFRHETFGDESFWGETLGLHRAIAGEANGGVGAA